MERNFAERRRRHHDRAFSSSQELQFELMRLASFNGFDGGLVVRDLRRHRGLWLAALMDRFGATDALTTLRDLPAGHWNADTLLLLAAPAYRVPLDRLVQPWGASTADWLPADLTGRLLGIPQRAPLSLLRLWWE